MPESFMNCKCGFWLAFVLPVVVLCSGGWAAASQKSCYRQLVGGGGRDGFTFESDPKKPSVPIVVTLGPGTAYREEIYIQPLEPSVLRMNLSHVGTDLKRWGDANNILRTVWPSGSAILADNPGPKIRITNSQSIALHTGISLAINREGTIPSGENTRDLRNLSMSIQEFDWMTENLAVGSPIVLGDDVEGVVTDLKPNGSFTVKITSLPKTGYVLTGNKGIQAPGVEVNAPALTSVYSRI
jgi:pyruvate kinase